MKKEIVICLLIIILVIIGENITQNYTKNSVQKISDDLQEIRKEIIKNRDAINKEKLDEKIKTIYEDWEKIHDKLAYYIEHDELEKIETNMAMIKGLIEVDEYGNSIGEIDKGIFTLNHIKDKYVFNLENIF